MKFKLNFTIPASEKKISYRQGIFLAGSCFAESIGLKLKEHYFKCFYNPQGILYNPISISKGLVHCLNNKEFKEEDLYFYNECWHSFQHHGSYSHPDKMMALEKINKSVNKAHEFIKQSDWTIVTFGSAFVYELRVTGEVVANCHKLAQNKFQKRLLGVEEIIASWNQLLREWKLLNPNTKFIFTLSPVRYIRDGISENNLSKALLLLSIHELVNQNKYCFYFPAYEIVMDELRDYRFFKEDLVHPSEQAIDYVWERFRQQFLDKEGQVIYDELHSIVQSKAHRPLFETTKAYELFQEKLNEKINAFERKFPYVQINS